MISPGEKSVFLFSSSQFKTQILACSLDFPENNYRNQIDGCQLVPTATVIVTLVR